MAISLTEKPISIKNPNNAVPKAVAKTIKAVVKALIEPRCLTPYSSAQVEDPKIFANPLEIPTNPKNIKAVIELSKKNKIITIFHYLFLLCLITFLILAREENHAFTKYLI